MTAPDVDVATLGPLYSCTCGALFRHLLGAPPECRACPLQGAGVLQEMRLVKSSNIVALGWAAERLRVLFHSGTLCEYQDVPAEVHQRLLDAVSVGQYFAVAIRKQPQRHPWRTLAAAPTRPRP